MAPSAAAHSAIVCLGDDDDDDDDDGNRALQRNHTGSRHTSLVESCNYRLPPPPSIGALPCPALRCAAEGVPTIPPSAST